MIKKVIYTDRTNALLNSYLREINRYKILDFSETYDLIKKAQQGDGKAREKVINANLRFVVTVAKQFQNRGIPLMDLIQAGNIGLANSIDKFNLTTGYAFLSYAIWWIKQSIFKSIYWESREIRLPMSQQVLVNSISDAIDKFLKDNNRNPSSEEISELTGIPVEQIDFLSQFSNKLVSVDDFIGGDEDNNQVCDIIPDGEPPLEDIIDKEFMKTCQHQQRQQQQKNQVQVVPHGQHGFSPEGGNSGTAFLDEGNGVESAKYKIIHHLTAVKNKHQYGQQNGDCVGDFSGDERHYQ